MTTNERPDKHKSWPHWTNLQQKLKGGSKGKYADEVSQKYLKEIESKYDFWYSANQKLTGPLKEKKDDDKKVIEKRVKLFSEYKDFIDKQIYAEKFDSRSNLHSSTLEEFFCFLFEDLVNDISKDAFLGKSHAFKDIFFTAESFDGLLSNPKISVEIKDHDFTIGTTMKFAVTPMAGEKKVPSVDVLQLPAVVIECKTYLDKNMLEGCSNAAAQLKSRLPDSLYLIAAEWLKLSEKVNIDKYQVDQVYIFRRQKNTDREDRYSDDYIKKPISSEVVTHLFDLVRNHITSNWESSLKDRLERGWLKGQ